MTVNENPMINPFRLSSTWAERCLIFLAYILAQTQTSMPRYTQAHALRMCSDNINQKDL